MSSFVTAGGDIGNGELLAQNAQDTANTANGGVNNINDPNKLAPAEKATLKRKYDTDVLLYGMDTKKLTDNQLSTSEIDSAMNALAAYMTPFFANMTTTDTVDRDTLNTVYKNFDTADKNADSAFTNMVSSAASDAMVAGNQVSVAGSEAIVAGNNASSAASSAAVQASIAVSNANVAQSSVATAITKAGFASDVASTASQAANDAKTVASQADNNVAIAKNDAANALTSAASAINNAKSALSEAKSASEKYESLGMVKAWGNTSPQNQNMNNWIMSDPAKKAATITCINGVNTIKFTGVAGYEVFNMPISAKIGKKVSVTFSYTQPSVINLGGTKNGIPVSFLETASLNQKVGTSPIYLGTDSQTDKVYTISTIATAETMYLSFNFGYLSDNHHWQFKVSVQQDMSTTTPTDDTPGYVGFANKQSDNPADYTWLRNPDKLEGDVQQQFTNINGQLESKVSKDTYDVLADTVSQTSTLVKQNQSELVTKADSQTVDTLKQRVTTAENTLTQTATKTELEQTKTDVDKLNNSVNANASNITAQAGKIDGLLSSTTDINGKLTTLQGNFDLSSKQLSTTMSKVDSLGQVNLVYNSSYKNNMDGWNLLGDGYTSTVPASMYQGSIGLGTNYTGKGATKWTEFAESKHMPLPSTQIDTFSNVMSYGAQVKIYGETDKAAGVQVCLSFYNASGTRVTGYSGSTLWVNAVNYGQWYLASGVNVPVPADAVTFGIQYWGYGTAVHVMLAHPMIVNAATLGAYVESTIDLATVTALTQVKQTAEGASQLSKDNQGNILALQSTAKGLQTSVSNAATKDQLDILSDTFSNKISSATSAANSKMIQTINNVGIGFKNPDGTTFQMNLSADGTALLDFSKIMLNGQTNIQAATIGNAQIANGAINQAKIANAAIGSAQIANGAITNAKIGNLDAGKITTGILDASHLNVDDVIANVINGKTITGIIINTPTLNLGDNGILTGTYSVADSTSYFQPINGTGKLDISHGYIQSTANLIYYNKIMRGMANSWGYWKDSVTFVPEAHLTIGNTAESTLTAGFLKLDIFDQAKTHVVSRAYVDGTGLYINSGGTEAVSSMLSDFELLSSGRAYLMGGVNVPKSEIITIGNLQINGYHTIASNDGRDVYFKKANSKGSAPVGIHAKSFTKYSQLSIKTDISDLPADEATRMLNSIDVEKYRYTSDDATYKYQYGAIIDDINELGNKQYSLPAELLSEDGTGINMDSMTGILIKTVQDQNKKIGELSMRLTRLEMA